MAKMKIISVQLPHGLIKAMDKLVEQGIYPSRSEVIRSAIRELLKKEMYAVESEESIPDYVVK
jgi:antitoxin ParD1/3/4